MNVWGGIYLSDKHYLSDGHAIDLTPPVDEKSRGLAVDVWCTWHKRYHTARLKLKARNKTYLEGVHGELIVVRSV